MKVEARPTGRRLRVVFSIDNMQIGGTELNAVRTAERLDRERFDLSVICLGDGIGPLSARYAAAGISVRSLALNRLYDLHAIRQFGSLVRFLRRVRPDIVHAHDLYSNQFAVPAARMAGVPGVIASRRWWWASLPTRVRRLANRTACRLAHRTLANAPAVARLLEEEEGISVDRIVVVPNFLDESAFDPPSAEARVAFRERHGTESGDIVIGMVANLRPAKDHATLIDALRLLSERTVPRFRTVLIGDGPCRPDLERAVSAAGLIGRVVFAGRSDPRLNMHHNFDVSVLSSKSEAFPNSILEAMAAGRAIVATDVGGVADAIEHGRCGLLVPPGDPAALADALATVILDAGLRERLGQCACTLAREHYSAGHVLGALEQLYASLAPIHGLTNRGSGSRVASAQLTERR